MAPPDGKLSEAQKEQLLAQMPPELREQAKAISSVMADLGAICKSMLPPKDEPDCLIPAHKLVMGMAAAPSFHALGDHMVPETLDALEKALIAHGAFGEGDLVVKKEEVAPPSEEESKKEVSIDGLSAAEIYGSWEDPTGKGTPETIRRNALLMYWIMYQHKLGEEVKLDPKTKIQSGLVNTIATKLLIRCQTVMPLQNK